MAVFVVGKDRRPCPAGPPVRCTIRLIDRTQADCVLQPLRLPSYRGPLLRKLDPGSKTTGLALVRVAILATGSFNITTPTGVVQGINHKHCRVVQRNDGYGYFFHRAATQDANR